MSPRVAPRACAPVTALARTLPVRHACLPPERAPARQNRRQEQAGKATSNRRGSSSERTSAASFACCAVSSKREQVPRRAAVPPAGSHLRPASVQQAAGANRTSLTAAAPCWLLLQPACCAPFARRGRGAIAGRRCRLGRRRSRIQSAAASRGAGARALGLAGAVDEEGDTYAPASRASGMQRAIEQPAHI